MAATAVLGALPAETRNVIKNANVLLVGANNVGFEVIKNLVMTGFDKIAVVDSDTVGAGDFPVGREFMGKPLAQVARESVLNFDPNVNVEPFVGDITDGAYRGGFFNEFNLVINVLDDEKARVHVNRMCLFHDIPLIDSDIAGANGRVQFIKKGLTECYECEPKPEPKSYPHDTFESAPKEPIDCVMLAKFLFDLLFGKDEEDVCVTEEVTTGGSSANVSVREWAKIHNYDPKKICLKLFIDDVKYLLSTSDLHSQETRQPVIRVLDDDFINHRTEYAHEPKNKVLSVAQYVTMFSDCVEAIYKNFTKSTSGFLFWNEDDSDFMQFVVACSNIQSEIFHIPLKSYFDIKSMASNVISTLPTISGIIGGQIVFHALRVLEGKYECCQNVFLRDVPNSDGQIFVKDKILMKPNPKCSSCFTDREIVLSTNLNTFTFKQFEDLILKKNLNMVQPTVLFDGSVLMSSDKNDGTNTTKTLADMGVQSGSQFSAYDYNLNYNIKIKIYQKERNNKSDPDFLLSDNIENLKISNEKGKILNGIEGIAGSDDEDCVPELKNIKNVIEHYEERSNEEHPEFMDLGNAEDLVKNNKSENLNGNVGNNIGNDEDCVMDTKNDENIIAHQEKNPVSLVSGNVDDLIKENKKGGKINENETLLVDDKDCEIVPKNEENIIEHLVKNPGALVSGNVNDLIEENKNSVKTNENKTLLADDEDFVMVTQNEENIIAHHENNPGALVSGNVDDLIKENKNSEKLNENKTLLVDDEDCEIVPKNEENIIEHLVKNPGALVSGNVDDLIEENKNSVKTNENETLLVDDKDCVMVTKNEQRAHHEESQGSLVSGYDDDLIEENKNSEKINENETLLVDDKDCVVVPKNEQNSHHEESPGSLVSGNVDDLIEENKNSGTIIENETLLADDEDCVMVPKNEQNVIAHHEENLGALVSGNVDDLIEENKNGGKINENETLLADDKDCVMVPKNEENIIENHEENPGALVSGNVDDLIEENKNGGKINENETLLADDKDCVMVPKNEENIIENHVKNPGALVSGNVDDLIEENKNSGKINENETMLADDEDCVMVPKNENIIENHVKNPGALVSGNVDDLIEENKNGGKINENETLLADDKDFVMVSKNEQNVIAHHEENPGALVSGNVDDLIEENKNGGKINENETLLADDEDCVIMPKNENIIENHVKNPGALVSGNVDDPIKENKNSGKFNENKGLLADDEDCVMVPKNEQNAPNEENQGSLVSGNVDHLIKENENSGKFSMADDEDCVLEPKNKDYMCKENEIITERKLAIKREAADMEDISKFKKSRVDE